MRIILKPVGTVCVLLAFVSLVWLAIFKSGMGQPRKDQVAYESPKNRDAMALSTVPTDKILNGGFEDNYLPVQPYSTVGKSSGVIAASWLDDSSWAPVTVEYSRDEQDPHGGKSCQKIAVMEVAQGKEARLQFVQELNLRIKTSYKASCWIRADRPTTVDFALRQKMFPYRYYGVCKVSVGRTWQPISVSGTPTVAGSSWVMVKVSKPVTLWVDDATIAVASTPPG